MVKNFRKNWGFPNQIRLSGGKEFAPKKLFDSFPGKIIGFNFKKFHHSLKTPCLLKGFFGKPRNPYPP